MDRTSLCEIAKKWGTDKVGHHEYTRFYYELTKDRNASKVLEIGIGHPGCMWPAYRTGASLFMWEEWFPNAQIYAFDIEPSILINRGRIRSVLCDQSNAESLRRAVSQTGGGFDLIVDDGSHIAEHQIVSAQVLAPYLSEYGVYVIEDVHVPPEQIISQIPKTFSCRVHVCPSPHLGNENLVVISRA